VDKSKLPEMGKGKVIKIKKAKTKPGAMDDNAKTRIKKRKKMLEDAAGN